MRALSLKAETLAGQGFLCPTGKRGEVWFRLLPLRAHGCANWVSKARKGESLYRKLWFFTPD